MTFIKITDGVVVQKQPYEEPGFIEAPDDVVCGMLHDGETFSNPPPEAAPEAPLALQQIACARLAIDGFDITGIERSEGIAFAMMLDENTAWLFFNEPQADTNYIVTPADGVTKTTEYIEVSCPGATSLALIVQRVQ